MVRLSSLYINEYWNSEEDMVCCIDCNMDYVDSRYSVDNMKNEYKKLLGFANEKNGNIFSVDCDEVKDIMYMANRGLIDALIYCRKKTCISVSKRNVWNDFSG